MSEYFCFSEHREKRGINVRRKLLYKAFGKMAKQEELDHTVQ